MRRADLRLYSTLALLSALSACAAQPSANSIEAGLIGMSKQRFLQCSGPPQISETTGGQEQLVFLTNRAGGAGVFSPAAAPVFACSGRATFQADRLVSVSFNGNPNVCLDVFAPCQGGQ